MTNPRIIDRPRRWDLPFSQDLATESERRTMSGSDVERLLSMEPFRAMDPARFSRSISLRGILENDTRIRKFRDGDVIVRQGDYGNSAFLILSGQVRVFLEGLDPATVGRRPDRKKSWVRSLAQLVTRSRSPEVRDGSRYPQMQGELAESPTDGRPVVVQDVTNVLRAIPDAFQSTSNEAMGEGALFGELAALGRLPRTATVAADGEAELLEIRWQGLRDLRRFDEQLRLHTDAQYRKFGLAETLRASSLLANLDGAAAERIAETADFETYGKFEWYGSYQKMRKKDGTSSLALEPVIAEEGHYANGLILLRAGFARLSRRYGNGERTVSYLGKGEIYGLDELVHNARTGEQTPLSATLRAIGYVDVVRISTKAFEEIILPRIPRELIPEPTVAAPRPRKSKREVEAAEVDPAMMEFLVENRFINGTATMLIDLDRCTRCDDCVRACAAGHDNNPRFIRHGSVFGHHMVANACMQCVDPVCMIGCPTGAIQRNEEGGEIVINDLTCIGCTTCASSCPYDNIRMVEVRDSSQNGAIMIEPAGGRPIVKATKCDLCVDHHGGPACERACPHDALIRADLRDVTPLAKWLKR